MKRTLLASLLVVAVATLSANAQILLVNDADTSGSGVTSGTISGFNVGAGNTLAVLVTSESGSSPTHSVTYNGSSVASFVSENEGNQRASVYYFLNAGDTAASGDVVVTFDSNSLFAFTALSLSNVASLGDSGTFGEPDTNLPRDINYTGTVGGYVVASFVDNDFNNGAPTLTISGDNINPGGTGDTSDYFQRIDGTGTFSAGMALAGSSIASNGLFTETFTDGGTSVSSRNAGALAAFVAVPEPTTFVMLLGGLGLVIVRRRRA